MSETKPQAWLGSHKVFVEQVSEARGWSIVCSGEAFPHANFWDGDLHWALVASEKLRACEGEAASHDA